MVVEVWKEERTINSAKKQIMEFKKQLSGYDPLSVTTLYLKIILSETGALLATGTGFVYEYEETYYLITNGHNVTRVNPENNKRITDHAGFPDRFQTACMIRYALDPRYSTRGSEFKVDLYLDKELTQPNWFIHPVHGYAVDVIAIPLTDRASKPEHVDLKPFNSNSFDTLEFPPCIADDVFVIGYPLDMVDAMQLPIWKRGSIATEPNYDIDKLPKVLVDTATRQGMSGSPVIYQRVGIHVPGPDKSKITDDTSFGRIRGFLGVYSGRIGTEDNLKAQLGIVWKESVIQEIIKGKKTGTLDFQNI